MVHEAYPDTRDRMAVTESMILEAILAGDLERLRKWGRQGVRATTAEPLMHAAESGSLDMVRCLVQELGADVNQAMPDGETPLTLIVAGSYDQLPVVCCLIELGAEVGAVNARGDTALLKSAFFGRYLTMQYLLEHAGANIEDENNNGDTVWDLLDNHLDRRRDRQRDEEDPSALAALLQVLLLRGEGDGDTALLKSAREGHYSTMQYLLEHADANLGAIKRGDTVWDFMTYHVQRGNRMKSNPAALIALMRVIVLRGAPPPALVALLLPEIACVVQEGARLQAQLPAYLVQRRALLDAHCPVLLPPLRALIHAYMELTTTEELWATGLGAAP
jgi:hypothetical protein